MLSVDAVRLARDCDQFVCLDRAILSAHDRASRRLVMNLVVAWKSGSPDVHPYRERRQRALQGMPQHRD